MVLSSLVNYFCCFRSTKESFSYKSKKASRNSSTKQSQTSYFTADSSTLGEDNYKKPNSLRAKEKITYGSNLKDEHFIRLKKQMNAIHNLYAKEIIMDIQNKIFQIQTQFFFLDEVNREKECTRLIQELENLTKKSGITDLNCEFFIREIFYFAQHKDSFRTLGHSFTSQFGWKIRNTQSIENILEDLEYYQFRKKEPTPNLASQLNSLAPGEDSSAKSLPQPPIPHQALQTSAPNFVSVFYAELIQKPKPNSIPLTPKHLSSYSKRNLYTSIKAEITYPPIFKPVEEQHTISVDSAWGILSIGYLAKYKGQCRYNQPHGLGTETWNRDYSRYYEGEWFEGKKSGFGIETGGTLYIGQWLNDEKNGWGMEITRSGGIYVGQWLNGYKNGWGIEAWSDGTHWSRCEGQWVKGFQEGWQDENDERGRHFQGLTLKGLQISKEPMPAHLQILKDNCELQRQELNQRLEALQTPFLRAKEMYLNYRNDRLRKIRNKLTHNKIPEDLLGHIGKFLLPPFLINMEKIIFATKFDAPSIQLPKLPGATPPSAEAAANPCIAPAPDSEELARANKLKDENLDLKFIENFNFARTTKPAEVLMSQALLDVSTYRNLNFKAQKMKTL